MLKVILWGGGIILIAVGIVLVYAATLPSEFRVSRNVNIKSSREKIFPLIADLRTFNQWNPFAKQDPGMTITYSGSQSGKGAADSWDSPKGNKGSLEIIDTNEPASVTMQLDMLKPMEGHNRIVFALEPSGNTTNVTWTMTGRYAYVAKVMGVVLNMDRMIGGEFDKGLADLKTHAETR